MKRHYFIATGWYDEKRRCEIKPCNLNDPRFWKMMDNIRKFCDVK